jgi:hypothetical protein
MITLMLLLGWPLYLICNISGRKYVGFVANIDIKIWRGGSHALLSVDVIFLLEVFSKVSSQQHGAYNRKGNVK